MLEYLKLCLFIVAFTMVFAFVQHDDYHKKFDKPIVIEYNCSKLNYETPKDVVTMCNDGRKFVIVKTYQE
jgi:hypothetical protein